MLKQRTSKLTATVLAVPLLLAVLNACSTADDTPAPDSSPESGNARSYDSFDDYQLAFAECMRGRGVDMPDPDSDGMDFGTGGDMDAFVEAAEACQDELGQPPAPEGSGSPVSDEERLAEYLEIAECFRANGIDVADPQPGGALDLPDDISSEVFEECAPNGITGPAGPGGNQ
ncbi:hypothetical protein ABZ863_09050 [Saccharomonospora sp. NPDC046836]|uniref:hypothetical protein n=1 Tax=Saccharomonospora sp. NPDC046836 TaxID=3156921 RepID=UPI0033EBEF2E